MIWWAAFEWQWTNLPLVEVEQGGAGYIRCGVPRWLQTFPKLISDLERAEMLALPWTFPKQEFGPLRWLPHPAPDICALEQLCKTRFHLWANSKKQIRDRVKVWQYIHMTNRIKNVCLWPKSTLMIRILKTIFCLQTINQRDRRQKWRPKINESHHRVSLLAWCEESAIFCQNLSIA